MMSEHTQVMALSQIGWTVYRVKTNSSRYHLAVRPAAFGHRRCAVLRGWSATQGRVDAEDSDPRVGGTCLFDLPSAAWVGQSLEVGTTTTSTVREVEEERDPAVVEEITRDPRLHPVVVPTSVGVHREAPARDAPKPGEPWAPYPERYVEYVEQAALLLGATHQRRDFHADVRALPELLARLKSALGQCLVMSKAVAHRVDP